MATGGSATTLIAAARTAALGLSLSSATDPLQPIDFGIVCSSATRGRADSTRNRQANDWFGVSGSLARFAAGRRSHTFDYRPAAYGRNQPLPVWNCTICH